MGIFLDSFPALIINFRNAFLNANFARTHFIAINISKLPLAGDAKMTQESNHMFPYLETFPSTGQPHLCF
jgi:hypothetical protein